MAIGFGAVGAILVVRKAVRRILQAARQRGIRLRMAEAEARRKAAMQQRVAAGGAEEGGGAAPAAQGRDEGDGERMPGACVVCLEAGAEMCFVACGHLCCCYSCGHAMVRCPICRTRSGVIKVYTP